MKSDAKTAIIFSNIHWHSTWQRHHHVAAQLAREGYRVLYVEPLPKRWPALGEWKRLMSRLLNHPSGAGTCPQVEISGVEIFSPKLFPDSGPAAQAVNQRFFIPGILNKILAWLQGSRPLVITYLPSRAILTLVKKLPAQTRIYDCVCDWAHDPYAATATLYEEELVKVSDRVIADSPHNLKRMQALHGAVIQIEGGVDYDFFEPARREKKRGNPPLCVYYGDIGVHTDLDLLAKVSERYRLRLIGPVRLPLKNFSKETEILGAVPYERLPGLLTEADVLLLPYRNTPHNQGVLPAKTFECLATGKPTVAIHLPSLAVYGKLFYLSRDHEDFLKNIDQSAFEEVSLRQERLRAAQENSWDRKAASFLC